MGQIDWENLLEGPLVSRAVHTGKDWSGNACTLLAVLSGSQMRNTVSNWRSVSVENSYRNSGRVGEDGAVQLACRACVCVVRARGFRGG